MNEGLSIRVLLLGIFFSFAASPALAGKSHAVVNGKSYHLNASYDWNENNFGFGFEHEFEQKSAWKKVVMTNGFRDSNENMSYMAGAGLHRRIYETDRLAGFYVYAGLNAFLMTREDVNDNKPFPGILPSLSIGNDKFGVNLTYLPKAAVEEAIDRNLVDPTLSGILFLQFKVSMDQLTP